MTSPPHQRQQHPIIQRVRVSLRFPVSAAVSAPKKAHLVRGSCAHPPTHTHGIQDPNRQPVVWQHKLAADHCQHSRQQTHTRSESAGTASKHALPHDKCRQHHHHHSAGAAAAEAPAAHRSCTACVTRMARALRLLGPAAVLFSHTRQHQRVRAGTEKGTRSQKERQPYTHAGSLLTAQCADTQECWHRRKVKRSCVCRSPALSSPREKGGAVAAPPALRAQTAQWHYNKHPGSLTAVCLLVQTQHTKLRRKNCTRSTTRTVAQTVRHPCPQPITDTTSPTGGSAQEAKPHQ